MQRLIVAFAKQQPRRTTTYQLVAGLEGRLPNADHTWEAYVSHGSTQVASSFHGFGSVERFRWLVTQCRAGGASRRQLG